MQLPVLLDVFCLKDFLLLLLIHRKLVVLSAQRNDAGAYTCEAKNPAGKATKEFLLKVNGML